MKLQLSTWGNGLALRIPAEIARELGVTEGDLLDARPTVDGGLSLWASAWNRARFASELDATRAAMPMGQSVIDELRANPRC
jgi:antitoxin MazE